MTSISPNLESTLLAVALVRYQGRRNRSDSGRLETESPDGVRDGSSPKWRLRETPPLAPEVEGILRLNKQEMLEDLEKRLAGYKAEVGIRPSAVHMVWHCEDDIQDLSRVDISSMFAVLRGVKSDWTGRSYHESEVFDYRCRLFGRKDIGIRQEIAIQCPSRQVIGCQLHDRPFFQAWLDRELPEEVDLLSIAEVFQELGFTKWEVGECCLVDRYHDRSQPLHRRLHPKNVWPFFEEYPEFLEVAFGVAALPASATYGRLSASLAMEVLEGCCRLPGRLIPSLVELALGPERAIRIQAERMLLRFDLARDAILETLDGSNREKRIHAARWARRLPSERIRDALVERLGAETDPEVFDAIAESIASLGVDIDDQFLSRFLSKWEPEGIGGEENHWIGKVPDLGLRSEDGRICDPEIVEKCLRWVGSHSFDRTFRFALRWLSWLDFPSRQRLGREILNLAGKGVNMPASVMTFCSHLPQSQILSYSASHLGARLIELPAPPTALLEAHLNVAHPQDFGAIQALPGTCGCYGLAYQIRQWIERLGDRRGWADDAITDRVVSRAGFDAAGSSVLSIPGWTFRVFLGPDGRPLLEDQRGAIHSRLPVELHVAQPQAYRLLRKKVLKIRKQVLQVQNERIVRLRESMLSCREWNWEEWKDVFLDHPVVGVLARKVLWQDDSGRSFLPVGLDGFETLEGRCWSPRREARIQVAHPARLQESELHAWREVFRERTMESPFGQMDGIRPKYDGAALAVPVRWSERWCETNRWTPSGGSWSCWRQTEVGSSIDRRFSISGNDWLAQVEIVAPEDRSPVHEGSPGWLSFSRLGGRSCVETWSHPRTRFADVPPTLLWKIHNDCLALLA